MVTQGSFATAEEAALCVARTPEGQAAAADRAAAAAPPLTSKEARQQARAEELTLLVAENNTGYFGVSRARPGGPKLYEGRVSRGGEQVYLGSFATAEEAALCVARSPEGQEAAGAEVELQLPWTREEALNQAQQAGLTLRTSSKNKTGYLGVFSKGEPSGHWARPYVAQVSIGGKSTYLGSFATAEEAAFLVAAETTYPGAVFLAAKEAKEAKKAERKREREVEKQQKQQARYLVITPSAEGKEAERSETQQTQQ